MPKRNYLLFVLVSHRNERGGGKYLQKLQKNNNSAEATSDNNVPLAAVERWRSYVTAAGYEIQ